MKYLITVITALLVALPAFASEDPKLGFEMFMKMVQAGDTNQAIKQYGIDERSNQPLSNPAQNLKMPGSVNYEVKDVKTQENSEEATISAIIDYKTVTQSAQSKIGGITTAGKAATGNVGGAATDLAKSKVSDSLAPMQNTEKVQMKQQDGEWKVVVTDQFYNSLTGNKKNSTKTPSVPGVPSMPSLPSAPSSLIP